MKKLYMLSMGFLILLGFTACDDENQKMFEGAPGLHLELSLTDLDSVVYSFMNVSEDYLVVQLPVQLTGYTADRERTFQLLVDPANTTAEAGVHYELLEKEYVLEKGAYEMNVPVTLKYTRELDSVAVRLTLTLKPSDEFVEDVFYRQRVTIVFSNQLPAILAANWNVAYKSYFGEYSQVKHHYILSELKLNTFMQFEDVMAWYSNVDRSVKESYGLTMNNFFATHEIYDEHDQRIEPWIY